MRTLVIGDIHGAYKALMQVLERANYTIEDKVIFLGDVADGWVEVPECVTKILSMPNTVYILGNHDMWLRDYLSRGSAPSIWTSQGGRATIDAYERLDNLEMNIRHLMFLRAAKPYYIDEENRLFVHGGFD
ncbi:MAG TPA: hypothetical protein ENI23_01235 [bacterium]|nr:hypothetical protein [bacterium]